LNLQAKLKKALVLPFTSTSDPPSILFLALLLFNPRERKVHELHRGSDSPLSLVRAELNTV
jgi:hypothetical protein